MTYTDSKGMVWSSYDAYLAAHKVDDKRREQQASAPANIAASPPKPPDKKKSLMDRLSDIVTGKPKTREEMASERSRINAEARLVHAKARLAKEKKRLNELNGGGFFGGGGFAQPTQPALSNPFSSGLLSDPYAKPKAARKKRKKRRVVFYV